MASLIHSRLRPQFGRLADALNRVGLDMPAFRLFEWLVSLEKHGGDDGLPPCYYRVLTTGSPYTEHYTEIGRRAAQQILALADSVGCTPSPETKVFEFGCGCGRVVKALNELRPVQVFGCDLHAGMIRWCRANLRGQYKVNRRDRPVPFADAEFDLVYALSVFTHMTRPKAEWWGAEIARVTRPGGLAILSFWDEHAPAAEPFRSELMEAGFYLKRGGTEGSNLMTGFFSHEGFAASLTRDWEALRSVPSNESASSQAMMVFRRR